MNARDRHSPVGALDYTSNTRNEAIYCERTIRHTATLLQRRERKFSERGSRRQYSLPGRRSTVMESYIARESAFPQDPLWLNFPYSTALRLITASTHPNMSEETTRHSFDRSRSGSLIPTYGQNIFLVYGSMSIKCSAVSNGSERSLQLFETV